MIGESLRRFAASGLSWPLSVELTDADIEARLFPSEPALPDALRPAPDWAQVNQEVRRKGVTLFLPWQKYMVSQPEGFLYSGFCEHYRECLGRLDAARATFRDKLAAPALAGFCPEHSIKTPPHPDRLLSSRPAT